MPNVIAVYLDEGINGDTSLENEEVLQLVERLREHEQIDERYLYVRVMRHERAGQTPLLYGTDGRAVRGLDRIREYVGQRLGGPGTVTA